MSREILFKAKNVATGEWVYGNYAFCDCYTKQQHYIFQNKPLEYAIDENTICQYTGLTDKNGNKIWENDVVECQSIIGRIGWNETHMAYTILASVDGNMQYYYIDESLSSDIEVIGNIFDNSELLKGE